MKKVDKIPFVKMVGTGNDFILFDNRSNLFSGDESTFFLKLCERRFFIGADGILLLEKGDRHAPVKMRYFNADGLEAAMCGNGARCVGYYAWFNGIVDNQEFLLSASDGYHQVVVNGKEVSLGMAKPRNFRSDIGILRERDFTEGGFVHTGVPHYVIFVPDIECVDVEKTAVYYRYHDMFPEGTNVDFVEVKENGRIAVRTYEKGVEGETLSCGTGCVASALLAAKRFNLESPVGVHTRGGELTVTFNTSCENVFLCGSVDIVFDGFLDADVYHSDETACS